MINKEIEKLEMTTIADDPSNFLFKEPVLLRAVAQDWVKQRTVELGASANIEEALNEVMERLYQRVAHNADYSRDMLVYPPSGDIDPYIFVIPVLQSRGRDKPKFLPATQVQATIPDKKTSSLFEEFQSQAMGSDSNFTAKDFVKDFSGVIVNAQVRSMWDGFSLYHNEMVQANKNGFKDSYNKTLGRYVIARLANNGVAIFTKTPFRHQTKGLALLEAKRLTEEFGESFGVFRCLDIVTKS